MAAPKKKMSKKQLTLVVGGVVALGVLMVAFHAGHPSSTPAPSHLSPPPPPTSLIHATPMAHPVLPPTIHPAHGKPTTLGHPAMPTTAKPALSVAQQEKKAITLLQTASQGNAWAVRSFPAGHGLYGVIYRSGTNQYGFAWTLPQQGLVFLGSAFDAKGEISRPTDFVLHALQQPAQAVSPVSAKTASATTRISALAKAYRYTSYSRQGHLGPIVTVYADPNSLAARDFWRDVTPDTSSGHIQVHWVIIAVHGKGSLARAEDILSAPDPTAAIRQNFKFFHTAHGKTHGSAPRRAVNSITMEQQVDANTVMLTNSNHYSGLAVFYCSAKTHRIQAVTGMSAIHLWPIIAKTAATGCGVA